MIQNFVNIQAYYIYTISIQKDADDYIMMNTLIFKLTISIQKDADDYIMMITLNFFQASLSQLLKLRINREDLS